VITADESGVVVACGADALRITELQLAGGRRTTAAALVAGQTLQPGRIFG
jgi:methionyl-tRNA formyltransferase